ncbi:hypothetical protein, partial [Stenotrophomonas sp. SrG]|uniref:hypothetical protein n=1 Tax=Stenotrophomonas sp. SrG TaxID=3414430 RepID=UPI003CEA10AB
VSLLNDLQQPLEAPWRLRVMDVDGRQVSQQQQAVTVPALSALDVGRFTDAQLLGTAAPARTVAVVDLREGKRVLSRQVVYFAAAQ